MLEKRLNGYLMKTNYVTGMELDLGQLCESSPLIISYGPIFSTLWPTGLRLLEHGLKASLYQKRTWS